uniref:Pantothenate synthetase n=1 Tax=Candidatus Kentrum eta TaxID=2126337 RepID=A0A450VFZ7_9GAMM|nr:MAG: pantoate--beta-alanine ligase [Candidatus Kentron sp. H]VFK03678.1 MAG: pantoate--beta-alanine ligase [Candidatus Kentron sp. H]VFK06347.1 MAG: pantoate--beta-alanine ligase [Candidatus Kentron sp. H]
MMDILKGIGKIGGRIDQARRRGLSIGFVPTMGDLHPGHIALVTRARTLADFTVVSIFVNPFQFAAGEDYEDYPRTLDADIAKLEEAGADLLFLPEIGDLYPDGLDRITRVEVPELSGILCGVSRPTFFRGVATVVSMLFHLVRPDLAVFGEKDYQQLLIIQRMVSDLKMPIKIIPGPTAREADGLAMSSRNRYLTAEERQRAPVLYRALCKARDALTAGDTDVQAIWTRGIETLAAAGLRPDYFEIRRATDLALPTRDELEQGGQDLRVLGATWLGKARLIDNVG